MTIDSEVSRLEQEHNRNILLEQPLPNAMITVYATHKSKTLDYDHLIYCALIPNAEVKKCLENHNWDLRIGEGLPESCIRYIDKNEVSSYSRFGSDNGIEPLIICREFNDLHPHYREISEEFRLFHRLYYDTKENKYIKIDESGRDEVIAIVSEEKIEIRLKEIRQFLAIKEMHLSIQFDYQERSKLSLEQLGLASKACQKVNNKNSCWYMHFTELNIFGKRAASLLLGKKMIAPLPKEKSGMFGFDQREKQNVEFIIGLDNDGDEIMGSPVLNPQVDYLTAVHFKKEVLEKYYDNPSKYAISDSYFGCGSLWGLFIDNNHDDKVCAWIGDLGKLPYTEQLHWKSHNIVPSGRVSDVFYRRQILGLPADSKQPDHIFKDWLSSLIEVCAQRLSWQLLLPLDDGDVHHLAAIRIPATNEQNAFDELVLSLTKLLIDSLNEKELNKFILAEDTTKIKGGISRLEIVFQLQGVPRYEEHIKFLRSLQDLRSTGSAHRKGKGYKKIALYFGMDSHSLSTVLKNILVTSNAFLEFLTLVIRAGYFSKNRIN